MLVTRVQDEELARQLVELGYRGSGEVIKREEFYARKQAAEQLLLARRIQAPSVLPWRRHLSRFRSLSP